MENDFRPPTVAGLSEKCPVDADQVAITHQRAAMAMAMATVAATAKDGAAATAAAVSVAAGLAVGAGAAAGASSGRAICAWSCWR